ncbi:MAG: nuclear transport factor 2 family protein [Acidobacteriaceae bacterium]|nr:nuclear transport factor 2 family protein [Acidobacteriaceae bacterium]
MKRRPSKLRKDKSRTTRKTINDVIRLEHRVWKVAVERNAKAFSELVPPDAIMIFQSGIVSQSEYLATMQERTISKYELGEITGFMPNPTTVILYYKALRIGQQCGETFPKGEVVESTTWIKRAGRWLAVLNQETPITPQSG